MTCSKKFWVENLGALFSSIQVVPLNNMNLAQQLNSMTRLVFIIFVVMILFDFKYSIPFLVISLLFIIIIYYIQRNQMNRVENYQTPNLPPRTYLGPSPKTEYVGTTPYNIVPEEKIITHDGKKYKETIFSTPEAIPFCNDTVSIDPPTEFATSMNQNLAGGAYGGKYRPNPKTLIPPVVVPKSHDLSYWKMNNLVTHSGINSEGVQQDIYLSGYAESTCCGYLGDGSSIEYKEKTYPKMEGVYKENYEQIVAPRPTSDTVFIPSAPIREGYEENYEQIVAPRPTSDTVFIPSAPIREGYEEKNYETILPNEPGWVNTACGYNPSQLYMAGLPTNLPSGNCEQNPIMKQYNENLHTQIVTPGVYTTNQINEPINSNIGISFQQQFEPTTCFRDDKGLIYTQHDPRIIEPSIGEVNPILENKPNYANVFDPRFYGYGTSYRSYLDRTTGQPRFMYDDVNAIRMPNYVVRSKIDHLPYADSYGPLPNKGEFGNSHNPQIRALVQDSWLRDSIDFRNDLTERQMRKINSEMWQKRQSPLGPGQIGSKNC